MARADLASIRVTVSIVELLGGAAKRTGARQWFAKCPFHDDSTASMSIRQHDGLQRFCCFGCGAKGDVLDFVMLRDGLRLPEACERLSGGRAMLQVTTPARRGPGLVLVCTTRGCASMRDIDGGDIAALLLDALVAGWIVCAAEDGAFDYCPRCVGALRETNNERRAA